jgi:hypothetical protein
MRQIPKNRIKENQYTNGTGIGNNLSLRFTVSKVPYVGFYNIVNGNKYFTGKVYDTNSKPLEKYNIIKTLPSAIAAAGSIATGANLNTSIRNIRYFYKDLTSSNINIKEINQSSFNQLSGNSSMIYQVISYNPNTQDLVEINKQMPGLLAFLTT